MFEFNHCCGAVVARGLCRMAIVLKSTSLFTASETRGVAVNRPLAEG
jgi:hypothetical protein